MTNYNVLILGASYGSLLATKLLFGGHKITMVCLPAEVEAFNKEGAQIRLPVRGRREPIELDFAEIAGQARRSWPRRCQPEGLRSRRFGDAGAAIPLPRGSRIARRGGDVARAVHVDHEHAALALSEAHRRAEDRRAQTRLYRCRRLGQFRARPPDLVQPGPAGHPAARREDQRPSGHLADQFQGGPVRLRQIHRDLARDGGQHRGRAVRSG